MDTCNKGFNYGILDELRACQEGLKKSCTGLLPSKYPVQQIARQLEAEASKYLPMEPDDTGLVCVFEPKKAISYFLFHFKYHLLGATADTRVLVALTGDGLRLTGQGGGGGHVCWWLKACGPQAQVTATEPKLPLVSEQN